MRPIPLAQNVLCSNTARTIQPFTCTFIRRFYPVVSPPISSRLVLPSSCDTPISIDHSSSLPPSPQNQPSILLVPLSLSLSLPLLLFSPTILSPLSSHLNTPDSTAALPRNDGSDTMSDTESLMSPELMFPVGRPDRPRPAPASVTLLATSCSRRKQEENKDKKWSEVT